MRTLLDDFSKNRVLWITLGILGALLLLATQSMQLDDWLLTVLRGVAMGAVIFLAAAGLSLIFGLMDVLNLAHGTLFMIGAYVGWSAYVRPDTIVDLTTPVLLLTAGFLALPGLQALIDHWTLPPAVARVWPWIAAGAALALAAGVLPQYPISIWNAGVYEQSPVVWGLALEQGTLVPPEPATFGGLHPIAAVTALLAVGGLGALAIAGWRTQPSGARAPLSAWALAGSVALVGIGLLVVNDALTAWLFGLDTTWRFGFAIVVAVVVGMALGGLMESTLIRSTYSRPIYQLMLTLGLGVIGMQAVIAIWGRPQISMVKPTLFNGTGDGCPARSLGDWLANQCATIILFDARVRVYNELFIIAIGLIVLVAISLVLGRSRLGMIIRAGVQDRAMVEALGINVQRVFTLVFAVGTGLAALGGVLSGPSTGLTEGMGESLLLLALIALAIGGLTSFPGAAAGAVLVGLLQQFMVKYGQIGIPLPFIEEPFKPTPPLVPASTVLLMVVILLVLPQGLFGRKE